MTIMAKIQAFKHVFTSPSSVEFDEPKATRSGNARIHGMTSVTPASVAYIATQVSPSAALDNRLRITTGSLFPEFSKHVLTDRQSH
jgi:hypothetical protein